MTDQQRRLTQADIARQSRVSQSTVSLVLNGSPARISPGTRARVLRVIQQTGYVADPIARRLSAARNQIIGVFTYEPAFPAAASDFYLPFLIGIEESAEELGWDLLLFTSTPARNGRRRIYHPGSRLRIADGCLLLGRNYEQDELARLLAEGFPFVSIGRRDDAGGPVPYVGADYAAATASLTRRLIECGHRTTAYVGPGAGAESSVDRFQGYLQATATAKQATHHVDPTALDTGSVLESLLAKHVTALLAEDLTIAQALVDVAAASGLSVPRDLSIAVLGEPLGPVPPGHDFDRFRIPRREMGAGAVEQLVRILEGRATREAPQILLSCQPVVGRTIASPRPTR